MMFRYNNKVAKRTNWVLQLFLGLETKIELDRNFRNQLYIFTFKKKKKNEKLVDYFVTQKVKGAHKNTIIYT